MNASTEILAAVFKNTEALLNPKSERFDADLISRSVTTYATDLGCNLSNVSAAVSWALNTPTECGTLAAVRAGRQRASQLYWRQAP